MRPWDQTAELGNVHWKLQPATYESGCVRQHSFELVRKTGRQHARHGPGPRAVRQVPTGDCSCCSTSQPLLSTDKNQHPADPGLTCEQYATVPHSAGPLPSRPTAAAPSSAPSDNSTTTPASPPPPGAPAATDPAPASSDGAGTAAAGGGGCSFVGVWGCGSGDSGCSSPSSASSRLLLPAPTSPTTPSSSPGRRASLMPVRVEPVMGEAAGEAAGVGAGVGGLGWSPTAAADARAACREAEEGKGKQTCSCSPSEMRHLTVPAHANTQLSKMRNLDVHARTHARTRVDVVP